MWTMMKVDFWLTGCRHCPLALKQGSSGTCGTGLVEWKHTALCWTKHLYWLHTHTSSGHTSLKPYNPLLVIPLLKSCSPSLRWYHWQCRVALVKLITLKLETRHCINGCNILHWHVENLFWLMMKLMKHVQLCDLAARWSSSLISRSSPDRNLVRWFQH